MYKAPATSTATASQTFYGKATTARGNGDDLLILNDPEKDYYDGGPGTDTFNKDAADVFKTIV